MRTIFTAFCLLLSFCAMAQNTHNSHEYVDLGLPSGLKWASCNVGATTPEGYGGYYAWGETEEKEDYSWRTHKWCNGSRTTLTKYCTDSNYGIVDNKRVLEPEDDVATVKWGGNWRMPTKAEQEELAENCTWTRTTLNGVNGCRVTGPNGNSIFLPAAGTRYGTNVVNQGSYGYYWSASSRSRYSYHACNLFFDSSSYDWNYYNRYYGHTVRPVCDDNNTDIEDIIPDTDATAVYYDLQGRRVEQPVSGIYIS